MSHDIYQAIDELLTLQQELYDKSARIFLFIDIPPVDRSPAYRGYRGRDHPTKMVLWNIELQHRIRTFAAEKKAAGYPITVLYFSSHKVIASILDDPEAYGFPKEDIKKDGGAIWVDQLHPTSAVHAVLAKELDLMLKATRPMSS
ncbi:hypothetical protein FRC17_005339 [Serendipita sp. 399]|nr:hypothetical protein FRC17_005339 [Serendipita sp. 399]